VGKGGRCTRLTDNLPPSCAVVTKSGKLNFLEHSGPAQACNGNDVPFNVCVKYNFLFRRFAQNCEKRILAASRLSVRVEQLGCHWADF